jgi:leucyl aminopeptidase
VPGSYLAQTAQALAKEFRLDCVVLEESDMSALGMGSLLSVSKGSIEPPKLITFNHIPWF